MLPVLLFPSGKDSVGVVPCLAVAVRWQTTPWSSSHRLEPDKSSGHRASWCWVQLWLRHLLCNSHSCGFWWGNLCWGFLFSQGLPNNVQRWLMECKSWLGGWQKKDMASSSAVCSYSLGHSSTFKIQGSCGILRFTFLRHKFIYCSRSCLSKHQRGCRTSHRKWGRKLVILTIQHLCSLHNSRWGMQCSSLLPACVLLYLICRVSSLWWFMETCWKLFLISLQAWKSSLDGCV